MHPNQNDGSGLSASLISIISSLVIPTEDQLIKCLLSIATGVVTWLIIYFIKSRILKNG